MYTHTFTSTHTHRFIVDPVCFKGNPLCLYLSHTRHTHTHTHTHTHNRVAGRVHCPELCSSKSLNPKNYVSGSVVLYSAHEA